MNFTAQHQHKNHRGAGKYKASLFRNPSIGIHVHQPMKNTKISIGLAQAMSRYLKEKGWAINAGKLTSRDGIIADIKLDGYVDLSIEGSSSVKTLGPFSSLADFRAALNSETMFNRFGELEELEDDIKAWSEMLHGYELRDDNEVQEFLKIVSPNYSDLLYQEFLSWNGAYYAWVRKEDRFGESFPFSGHDLISHLHSAMDGNSDWNTNVYYDIQEAIYGCERTRMKSDWEHTIKWESGMLNLDRYGNETIDCGQHGEIPQTIVKTK